MSLDDLQAQLRGALDQQFAALKHQYELSIEDARRDAAAEAEREFNAKLDLARAEFHQARTEWESQLQELVIAARADAEQCAAQAAAVERQEYQQQLQARLEQRVEQLTAAAQRTAALEQESERRRAQNEIDAAREQAKAEVDAERQRLQQERDAERQRLQQDIAAARQRLQQEREGERAQAEQAAQQEREAARQQAQQEREAERQQVQQEREAERQQLKQLLLAERQKLQQQLEADGERARQVEALTARHQAELAAAKQAASAATATAAAAAATAANPAPAAGLSPAAFDRVLAAISDLDGTQTLASALDLLLAHSGAVAGRAALFLIDGDRLKAWKSSGIPDVDVKTAEASIAGTDLLARAIQAGRATASSPDLPSPPFARLPAGGAALAVPVMIGGRAVAVLYADSGAKPSPPGSDATIELLARHTSTVVALRTAMRTLDVLRGVPADMPNGHADEQSARRFARLLVSEIKLYNEPAVRAGRQQRDLRQRLSSEIDRAQRLYEERVPPAVSARSAYFQHELVQTLADGDATLLGSA